MAMDSENIKARAYAFGTLSTVRRFRRLPLQAVLWCLRAANPDRVARELSFLHFAQWSLLPGSLVHVASAESGDARKRHYLLFLSAFSGEWNESVQPWRRALTLALNSVWTHCEGWPGAEHSNAFRAYVDTHEVSADAYFDAYGNANAEDIRAALRLAHALEQFALESGAAGDARRFRHRYERLLVELGSDLAA